MNRNKVVFFFVFSQRDMVFTCEHIYMQANMYANLVPLDDIQREEREALHVPGIVLSKLIFI